MNVMGKAPELSTHNVKMFKVMFLQHCYGETHLKQSIIILTCNPHMWTVMFMIKGDIHVVE